MSRKRISPTAYGLLIIAFMLPYLIWPEYMPTRSYSAKDSPQGYQAGALIGLVIGIGFLVAGLSPRHGRQLAEKLKRLCKHRAAIFSLGALFLFAAIRSLLTEQVLCRRSHCFTMSEDPVVYWFHTGVFALGGTILVVKSFMKR